MANHGYQKYLKKTLPNKLYGVLFSIDNLRLPVKKTKRILTKENIERQLAGQSSSITPFMKVSEGYHTNEKAVLFNTRQVR